MTPYIHTVCIHSLMKLLETKPADMESQQHATGMHSSQGPCTVFLGGLLRLSKAAEKCFLCITNLLTDCLSRLEREYP
jgi:hypothetical protein